MVNGGFKDGRRACGGLLEPVGTSFSRFSGLCKNGCSKAFSRKDEEEENEQLLVLKIGETS